MADAEADADADEEDEEDEELVHAASRAMPATPPAVPAALVRNRRRSNRSRCAGSPSRPPSPWAWMSSVHSARLTFSAGMVRSWWMPSRSAVMARSSASDRCETGSLALIYMAPWLAGAALVVG